MRAHLKSLLIPALAFVMFLLIQFVFTGYVPFHGYVRIPNCDNGRPLQACH